MSWRATLILGCIPVLVVARSRYERRVHISHISCRSPEQLDAGISALSPGVSFQIMSFVLTKGQLCVVTSLGCSNAVLFMHVVWHANERLLPRAWSNLCIPVPPSPRR
jgi:hypothetical protein